VKCHDPETGNILVFFTNNFDLQALIIAELYKQRWQVDCFSNGSSST
jgi:IS4 transposase